MRRLKIGDIVVPFRQSRGSHNPLGKPQIIRCFGSDRSATCTDEQYFEDVKIDHVWVHLDCNYSSVLDIRLYKQELNNLIKTI